MDLVLASASPRRKDLLHQAGLSFILFPVDCDETLDAGMSPENAVTTLALRKARAARTALPGDAVILSADTVVALDQTIFGKPTDRQAAFDMLKSLSGKTHQVYTGVCLYQSETRYDLFSVKTDVTFFELSDSEISAYLDTGEYRDKAGAYGIQGRGALLVEGLHGDYFNVVGLPVSQVVRHLQPFLDD